ncbi:carboxymuconolactone decarboxylase family protein [Rhodococcus sp. (in: high G+C Gram-positive bacteria)]|uniref:carboxymuconolactone decarboxylase family protein n=1 Tax=Rhodococcus sp. TaxID=1831 RepID=UPI003890481D
MWSPAGGDSARDSLSASTARTVVEEEVKEAILHLAFYAGWPNGVSAITVAEQVFGGA